MAVLPAAHLVIRDALARDSYAVTTVLAAAFTDSPLCRWLCSRPADRRRHAQEYIATLVRRSITSGICRVAVNRDEVVGAALWLTRPGTRQPAQYATARVGREHATAAQHSRSGELAHAVAVRRPVSAYQELVFLGVRPGVQRHGIGTYLLISHHALLHVLETPAFAVVVDERVQAFFERHGYHSIGPRQLLSDRVPVAAMWRPPVPADVS